MSPVAALLALNWMFVAILVGLHPLENIVQEAGPVRNKLPDLPLDIYYEIVCVLEDCPDILRRLNKTTKRFNKLARPIQFRTIHVLSTDSLVQLSSLLQSEHCTIPGPIDRLIVKFDRPQIGRRIDHSCMDVGNAFSVAIDYFDVRTSVLLDLHWLFSRELDWMGLQLTRNITKFALHGTYSCISDVPFVLSQMEHLESLILDATFASDKYGPTLIASPQPLYTFISPHLKEIVFSPACLVLMVWMASLQRGPMNLHLVRIRVDDMGQHSHYFHSLAGFLQKYGSMLRHLYVSFEETTDASYEGPFSMSFLSTGIDLHGALLPTDLADALQHTPRLRQLELLLPSSYTEIETEANLKKICKHIRSPGPTAVRGRGAYDIGVDGEEFWEDPFLCRADEVCKALREL